MVSMTLLIDSVSTTSFCSSVKTRMKSKMSWVVRPGRRRESWHSSREVASRGEREASTALVGNGQGFKKYTNELC